MEIQNCSTRSKNNWQDLVHILKRLYKGNFFPFIVLYNYLVMLIILFSTDLNFVPAETESDSHNMMHKLLAGHSLLVFGILT